MNIQFDPQTIEDHATRPTRGLRKVGAALNAAVSPMDILTARKKTKIARSVVGAPVNKVQERVKKHPHKPPWTLSPAGDILCTYHPDEEPLIYD
jgi:hypothetical protein